mmetsp:Transcript_90549/g.242488  ORF Transcript_90549/g.242488 Transcript_90549/m.242488 type:complete len:225 (+) Transcript_90549:1069-1743(+)
MIPWIVGLILQNDYVCAVLLVGSQYFVLGYVEASASRKTVTSIPAWVTGLSVVLGNQRWGSQAFIIGPLIVSLVIFMVDRLLDVLPQQDDEVLENLSGLWRTPTGVAREIASEPEEGKISLRRAADRRVSVCKGLSTETVNAGKYNDDMTEIVWESGEKWTRVDPRRKAAVTFAAVDEPQVIPHAAIPKFLKNFQRACQDALTPTESGLRRRRAHSCPAEEHPG